MRLGRHAQKDSYYRAQFHRLRARGGGKQANCAVAASILAAIYHMLKNGTKHVDLGATYFDQRPTLVKAKRLAARLEKLSFHVELNPIQSAA